MIDDNEWPTRMYVLALEQAGLAVKHCRTTDEALRVAPTVAPSALVVDIMIPPGQPYREKDTGEGLRTGILLYADLRTRFPDVPAFILTNMADPDVLAHFQPGPRLCVVKKDDTPPRNSRPSSHGRCNHAAPRSRPAPGRRIRMEKHTKLTEAIEALDHVQELLQALPPELLESGLWEVVMGLSVLQKFLRSFDAAASADDRATALIEVSEIMGKKCEGLLLQVIQDPSTPEMVTRAARQAQSRVERRARKELLDELATSTARHALMDEIAEVIGPRLTEFIDQVFTKKKPPTSGQPADLHQPIGQVVEEKLNAYYRKRVEGPVLIDYHGLL
jgi:hypothetical protein